MPTTALVFILLASIGGRISGSPPPASGGGSYTPGAGDHAGQVVQAQGVEASAASGSVAYRMEAGAKLCADGATGAACVVYEIIGDKLRATRAIEAPALTLTNIAAPLTVSSNALLCLNGTACTSSISHNTSSAGIIVTGTVVSPTLSGATLSGSTTAGAVSVTSLSSSGAVSATTGTFSDATTGTTVAAGAKHCLNGATCDRSIRYNTGSGRIDVAGAMTFSGGISNGNLELNGGILINKATSTNSTCASGIEGGIRFFNGTGAASGSPTKLCICLSDGLGAYYWRNLGTSTNGTSSNC